MSYFAASSDSRSFARKFIQAYKVATIKRSIPLAESSHENLRNTSQRAASRQSVPVQGSAKKEDHVGQTHGNGQRTKGRAPSMLHLDVDHCREGHDGSNRDRQVEEVEEAVKV